MTEARGFLRMDIDRCGGLYNAADIGRRYGKSRSTIHEWTHKPDFPGSFLDIGNRPVWLGVDVQDWVAKHK